MVDDQLAEFSRALFKNAHVLPAALQICRFTDGRFTRRQLSRALGANDNVVDTVLDRFRDAHLIKEGERTRGGGAGIDLVRQSSPFWVFAEEISDALLGPPRRPSDDPEARLP